MQVERGRRKDGRAARNSLARDVVRGVRPPRHEVGPDLVQVHTTTRYTIDSSARATLSRFQSRAAGISRAQCTWPLKRLAPSFNKPSDSAIAGKRGWIHAFEPRNLHTATPWASSRSFHVFPSGPFIPSPSFCFFIPESDVITIISDSAAVSDRSKKSGDRHVRVTV